METYKYFLNQEVIEGKRLIEEAVACGDFIATYIHGVILLCESNPEGIGNLLEVLNDEHGKHTMNIRCNEIATCNSFFNQSFSFNDFLIQEVFVCSIMNSARGFFAS